ncbi:MAG: YtxH domain-containing protein [Bacilli bacterium]|nr:YtxH domain-containing protein [Bacilli bacterium]
MSKKGSVAAFAAGAAIGAGVGILFAPKSGEETRKELKEKLEDLVNQIKQIDVKEVKEEFDLKVKEIKAELNSLDKEKVLEIAKKKGNELRDKAQELVDLAKEKGTPKLKKAAESILENVIKVSNDAIKKLNEEK